MGLNSNSVESKHVDLGVSQGQRRAARNAVCTIEPDGMFQAYHRRSPASVPSAGSGQLSGKNMWI